MIASQKIGKSFMGALGYNLKKLNHPDPHKRAELLDTNFTSLGHKKIAFEVDLVKQLRPSLNKYVYHTSLNFHNEDKLNNEQLLNIAQQYLDAMGYSNNQYFIFRHHDADHPHLHLLVNRITFDGDVISDSNNYKRSEQVLRNIERQYNLVQVNGSQNSKVRAATKNEIEKIIRTGRASDRLVLQEIMKMLSANSDSITDLIAKGEQAGVHFLFNQQSTGRISGITYFFRDLKIAGQKLGNQFKWAELIKKVNYEQDRDSKAITEANGRTKAIYGDFNRSNEQQATGQGSNGLHKVGKTDFTNEHRQEPAVEETGNNAYGDRKRSLETNTDADTLYRDTADTMYRDTPEITISIAEDVDDEAVYGKNRRKKNGYGR